METLKECYTRHLLAAVADPKNRYAYGIDQVPLVADRMIAAAAAGNAHLAGPAWTSTPKELRIKRNHKAVKDFIANNR